MAIIIDKSKGYVLIWRSIMDTFIWANPKLERLYHWVMYRANFENKEVFETRNKTRLKPGQFITSLPHAAKELGMGQATVDAYLDILKSERIIDRTPTPKYTVITILNWDNLQNPDRKSDRKRRADGELTDTDNTLNTLNTVREDIHAQKKDTELENQLSYLLSIPSKDLLELSEKYVATQEQIKGKGEDLHNYCKAKGKKYTNYKAFLSNALKRDFGLRESLSTFPERPGFIDAKTLKYH